MDKEFKEQIEQTQAMNELLLEMVKNQKEANKSNFKVFISVIICYTLLLISMVVSFFIYESQFEIASTTETITTTTQEVSGQDSEINNIQGNMYKDNAVHNN